ncbi:MAG: Lrp/AsnC ligand binding domain-containing protein [Nitrososphaerales archaeon]
MKAYVEIKVEPGSNIQSLLSVMRNVEGVREAFAVTGHTDLIAAIEASDLKGIAELVTQRIHPIRGIMSTETMVCVED